MNATIPPVQFGGATGYLFENDLGDGVCFVPEACLRVEARDQISVDDVAYLVSGWARTNSFLNPFVPGHRIFPNTRAVPCDFDAPLVTKFLGRIRHLEHLLTRAA